MRYPWIDEFKEGFAIVIGKDTWLLNGGDLGNGYSGNPIPADEPNSYYYSTRELAEKALNKYLHRPPQELDNKVWTNV